MCNIEYGHAIADAPLSPGGRGSISRNDFVRRILFHQCEFSIIFISKPQPYSGGRGSTSTPRNDIMQFTLFLIVNAMLFIRPSELVSELHAVELYRYFIVACLAVSFPTVMQQWSLRPVGIPPVAACVFLTLPIVFFSGFSHGNIDLVLDTVIEFAKVVIYFVLLVALVVDVDRLRRFLRWIAIFSAMVTVIAVARYHADVAAPPTRKPATTEKGAMHGTFVVDQVRDPATGQMVDVQRMCGTGIFNDPNDFALLLAAAIPMCLCWLIDPRAAAQRVFWLGLLIVFGYALMLTHSRGGLIALMAGMATLLHMKYGGRKTLLLGAICFPALLFVFAGRMTDVSTESGTGQSRIQLWSEWLMFFRQSPLFGIGMGNHEQYHKHVAHNSFIHSYGELGIIGGTLFLGAFLFALKGLLDLRVKSESELADDEDAELRRIHPFLMASLVAYCVGICFLSRCYVVPTYMMLGVALAYMRMRAASNEMPVFTWTRFAWPRLAGLSFAFLVGSHIFVQFMVVWR